jgi:hypothetical protein
MIDMDVLIARVVALCGQITGVDTASDEYPSEDNPLYTTDLPYVFVSEGRATYTSRYARTDIVTQEYILLFYIATWEKGNPTAEQTARESARVWQQRVHRFFLNKSRLELNDNGLNSINSARLVGHDGLQSASRNGSLYYGIAFRLNIEYEESLD